MKPLVLTFIAIACQLMAFSHARAEGVKLTDTTTIEFASVEAGRAALTTPDRYTKVLTRFDLESRLRTNEDVTPNDLMQFSAEQVIPWSDADQAKVASIVASISKRFADYELPFPPEILLIQTTGKEEGDAAYCRRHTIIFPRRYVGFASQQLERIFIHELFHVLSSHNEKLRHALYEIIGFKPCPEIALPASLADSKITNPDGPTLSYYIELYNDGAKQLAVPLLYSPERFDPEQKKSFFGYMKFRLLVVERDGDDWSVVIEDGQPLLLDPKQTPSFHQQIGSNTKYIIHPDEVLADNFLYLMTEKPNLPDPEIVAKMEGVLVRSGDKN